MQVQIVKCSEDLWYKNKKFPIKTTVEDSLVDINSDSYNQFFVRYKPEDFYYSNELMGFVAKSDCINDEEYSDTLEESKKAFCYEYKARPWDSSFKPKKNSVKETVGVIAPYREFPSGAKRDSNKDKPFVHNIKGYTRLRFGYHMTKGANKHGDGNWEKGLPTECYLESVDRHLARYLSGDRSEDHLSAIIFGIQGCMINEQKSGVEVDFYYKK